VPSLIDLFDEKNHAQLPGGILESFGRLFKNDLKLYVYPLQPSPDDELRTVNDISVLPELQPLYDYLAGRGSFVHLDNYRPEFLPIFSRDVLRRIAANDDSWEDMVPEQCAELAEHGGDRRPRRVGRVDEPQERLMAGPQAAAAVIDAIDEPGGVTGLLRGPGVSVEFQVAVPP